MQIIVSGNAILATYPDFQDISQISDYRNHLIFSVPDGTPAEIGQPWPVTLEQAKAARIAEATAVCDAILTPLGVEYGRWETATWDQQYAEAMALMAEPAASVPLIAALSLARGMEVGVLAQRIIRNRETWSVLTGNVIGQRLAIVDRINAAATVADVLAVPISITLPTGG